MQLTAPDTVGVSSGLGFCKHVQCVPTVDDINPALPIVRLIRNIP